MLRAEHADVWWRSDLTEATLAGALISLVAALTIILLLTAVRLASVS